MLERAKTWLTGKRCRRILVVKAVVTSGMLAAYSLPGEAAVVAGVTATMIWIWGDL